MGNLTRSQQESNREIQRQVRPSRHVRVDSKNIMYSHVTPAGETKRTKGVKRCVVDNLLLQPPRLQSCSINNIEISKDMNLFRSRLQRTYTMQESSLNPGRQTPHLERWDQHPRDWAFSVEDINKMTEILVYDLILPNKPLSNWELERAVMDLCIPHFRVVFMRDTLPSSPRRWNVES